MTPQEELKKIDDTIEYLKKYHDTDIENQIKYLEYIDDMRMGLSVEYDQSLKNNNQFKEEHNDLINSMKRFRKSLIGSIGDTILNIWNKRIYCKHMIKLEEEKEDD